MYYFVETVSQTSLKASPAPLLCRALLSAWRNLAGVLRHACTLSGRIKNDLLVKSVIRFDQAGRKFQQSLWLCLCPTLRYITEIFTSVSSTELFQKHIFVHVGPSCSLPLPHSLFHKPSMWNHGNRDIFFCVSKAHKALNITLKSDLSDGIYMKTSYKLMFQTCLWFLFFFCLLALSVWPPRTFTMSLISE